MKKIHVVKQSTPAPSGHRIAWAVFRGGLRGRTLQMLWLLADYRRAVSIAQVEIHNTESDVVVWPVAHHAIEDRTMFL